MLARTTVRHCTQVTATWRARTPNEWESLVHWQDVLVWRSFIYNHIIKVSAFEWKDGSFFPLCSSLFPPLRRRPAARPALNTSTVFRIVPEVAP